MAHEDIGERRQGPYRPRYIDIGINLADPIFRGVYHGTQRHADDLDAVIDRARGIGCTKMVVTGSDFKSSRDALELTAKYPGTIYSTMGIHPCSSRIFGGEAMNDVSRMEQGASCGPVPSSTGQDEPRPDSEKSGKIIADLEALVKNARAPGASPGLVAFGEFGLDYDRLHYCSKSIQLHSFAVQLDLAASLSPQLPLFLHSRAAHDDFVGLLKATFGSQLERLEKGGVVHSFTGTIEEMKELTGLGLYIGVNGCSFKTAGNCAVVKEIDLNRLMLETDGPWCEVRPSHEGWKYLVDADVLHAATPTDRVPARSAELGAKKGAETKTPAVYERYKVVKKEKWLEGAMVKGRNEPCMIERVARIVAKIKGLEVEDVCEAAWNNTTRVFALSVKAPA